jgi:predicted Ser/Thr protein kinase
VTPERWRQINDLFHVAAERDAQGRRELLDQTAATDPELAAEVRSLLAMHESTANEFLEQPAWAVAPTLAFDEDTTDRAGQMAGPYRIVKEIGRGGMGVVYEAEDTRLRRSVALKALPSEYSRDPVRRERLMREARAAAALTHPAIATIYALDELDGVLYLVSELVRGQTLREELGRGAVPADKLLPTLIDLASGLAAAHAAGIVHRDFKPENIVRCTDGRVKILDFGLARMEATQTRLTQTGMAVGTPGYMPPEQLSGQTVDARTDVFAFGVVAWELATGTHPFGASAAELLARMTDLLDGRTITFAGATLPIPGLETILRRCLRRNPAERYRSADQLLADLERLRVSGVAMPALTANTPAAVEKSLWWWQVHQAIIATVIASMPVATWFVRRWSPAIGPRIFLGVLALATIAVTIRLNLLFTSRVNRPHLAAHRARVFRATALIEGLLGFVLLASAALVTDGHDGLAAVLVTLSVATVASLGIVEPVTTAAAGIAGSDQLPTSPPPRD